MSVYVDDMEAPYGRLVMCHMIADTHAELIAMVDRIGVQRKWIQQAGTPEEHFDIAKSKRALAVQAGAVEITLRELATKTRSRWSDWPGSYFSAPAEGASGGRCSRCGHVTRGHREAGVEHCTTCGGVL